MCVLPAPGLQYLMCVAGRDSSCLDRNNSRCRSWCLSFSGRSTISGFSISSSISPEGHRGHVLRPLNRPIHWWPRPRPHGAPAGAWAALVLASPPQISAAWVSDQEGRRVLSWPGGDGGDKAAAAARPCPEPSPPCTGTPSGPSCRASVGPPRRGQAGAGMQPGTQVLGPSCEGGSYLPRRCRPPIRFYSRLTALYNRQTAPRRRISRSARSG